MGDLSSWGESFLPFTKYMLIQVSRIYFIRQLARHHLPALTSNTPIMAIATHPGAVATEQQKGATEAYGKILGGALETAASYLFMAPEQGAESALWAGTAPSVTERREEVQGRYFTEADGKVSRGSFAYGVGCELMY
jgi:WW domain-containing oxidoreductase